MGVSEMGQKREFDLLYEELDEMLENDEISSMEEGFMRGNLHALEGKDDI